MQRPTQTISLLLTLGALFGCSSAEEEEPPVCWSTEVVQEPSFRTDLLPIIQNSCNLSTSCHGKKGSTVLLYLGKKKPSAAVAPMTDQEVTDVLTKIVNMPSKTVPAENLITAGDASASFLMHKMDNTHLDQGYECTSQADDVPEPCGESMPKGTLLCDQDRDMIRTWINAGAKDN